jgi:hypothetical protein
MSGSSRLTDCRRSGGKVGSVGCAHCTEHETKIFEGEKQHRACFVLHRQIRIGHARSPEGASGDRRPWGLGRREGTSGPVSRGVGVKWSSLRARSGPYRSHWLYGLHDPLSFAERLLVELWSMGIISQIGSNRDPTQEKEQ